MVRAELVVEAEDAVGAGFRGVEVILRAFEGCEVFDREVVWEAFDWEVGKIVGHSIESWGRILRVFICDCDGCNRPY